MIASGLATVSALLAALPALMVLCNLRLFRPPVSAGASVESVGDRSAPPRISVLIPARDEAASISDCMNAALRSAGVAVEVVVLDDHSTDATADIVLAVCGRDTRVRLIRGKPLPEDWNGKQHACWQLASAAQHPILVFLDADVRLRADALRRLADQMQASRTALLSAFPHQETESWLERLLIPLMHFILLGYLPIDRMRASTHPAYAAGCGQLFMTDRSTYDRAGSHAAIRRSRHDGVTLPKAYRRAGMATDICDGSDIASCRMYRNAGEVVRGVLKNATEGIAHPRRIIPFTILLLGGSVLPFIALSWAVAVNNTTAIGIALVACTLAWLPRWMCAIRFAQSKRGALLHPLGVSIFVALQWQALVNHYRGKTTPWKGRTDEAGSSS